jgi:hypothetical protein
MSTWGKFIFKYWWCLVLVFELGTLCVWGTHFTTWATPSSACIFIFVVLGIEPRALHARKVLYCGATLPSLEILVPKLDLISQSFSLSLSNAEIIGWPYHTCPSKHISIVTCLIIEFFKYADTWFSKGSSLILGLSFHLIDSTLKHIFF